MLQEKHGSESVLERKIEGLNKKMLAMVNESIQSGLDIESREDEFKAISDEVEAMKRRIAIIRESQTDAETTDRRLSEIQAIIADREFHKDEYDDSVVRQMIECIKVYPDGRLEVIFGGGILIEESLIQAE